MALSKDDLHAIEQLLEPIKEQLSEQKEQLAKNTQSIESLNKQVAGNTQSIDALREQQAVHTRSILSLENKTLHELKLLNENLPDVIVRHEELKILRKTVDDHSNRIFALEQVANK